MTNYGKWWIYPGPCDYRWMTLPRRRFDAVIAAISGELAPSDRPEDIG